jgi:hypothetical protein
MRRLSISHVMVIVGHSEVIQTGRGHSVCLPQGRQGDFLTLFIANCRLLKLSTTHRIDDDRHSLPLMLTR